jgi:hypothetical protein
MYCPFCGKKELLVKEYYYYSENDMQEGGRFYCTNCLNELIIRYNPIKLVKVK